MSFSKTQIRFKRLEMYHFIQTQNPCLFEGLNWDFEDFKTKSGFCVWYDQTPRGLPTYLNFIENQVGIVHPISEGDSFKSGLVVLEVRMLGIYSRCQCAAERISAV